MPGAALIAEGFQLLLLRLESLCQNSNLLLLELDLGLQRLDFYLFLIPFILVFSLFLVELGA